MINQWIGNYRITNYLGKGSGFTLFRAVIPEDPETRYSIKKIPRNGVPTDTFIEAFSRLAQQLGALESSKVLQMREILFDEEAGYLIGEYLHGHSIEALLGEDGIGPIPHAIGLFSQAVEAVSAAHGVGVLHGGLTAEHLLYAQEKYVKIDGFGLPLLLRDLGLPGGDHPAAYRAPELEEAASPTVSSEIYALGVMLVHLLTGSTPGANGHGRTPPLEHLDEARPGVPERLRALVQGATTEDPEQRFRSAAELGELSSDRSSALVGTVEPTKPKATGLVQLGLSGKGSASDEAAQPTELPEVGDLPEWVEIPAGPFEMGSDRRRNEGPVHTVDLPIYSIAATPTTNRQFRRYCEAVGREVPEDPPGWGAYAEQCPDHPVVNINWKEAEGYCAWLSEQLGDEVRLPREEEWEKAARGGLEGKHYPWGDETPDGRAQFGGRAYAWEIEMEGPQTRRVGCFSPNGFGLYDMAGNVWEMCSDWYTPYGTPQPRAGVFRVARGGSWAVEEDSLHCSFRMSFYRTGSDFFIGFRCVRAA